MLGKDGITGLAVAAASLVLFTLTLSLERNPLVPVGPAFYPQLVLGATAFLGLVLAAQDWLRRRSAAPAPPEARAAARLNYPLVALSFAVFAVYVILLPLLGYRIATFAFAVALDALLSPPRSLRGWLVALVFGFLTSLATYYAFEGYLQVLLPRGSWTGF